MRWIDAFYTASKLVERSKNETRASICCQPRIRRERVCFALLYIYIYYILYIHYTEAGGVRSAGARWHTHPRLP